MFTAEGGHGTEFLVARRARQDGGAEDSSCARRRPREARKQVREAEGRRRRRHQGDPRGRLGRGNAVRPPGPAAVPRRVEEAHAQHLPLAIHTGDARDVADAVEIGAAASNTDRCATRFPTAVGADGEGGVLRPDAGGGRGVRDVSAVRPTVRHSLVQQVVSERMLNGTRRESEASSPTPTPRPVSTARSTPREPTFGARGRPACHSSPAATPATRWSSTDRPYTTSCSSGSRPEYR